ncbi:unnamed protein product, partial [Anisakis simplex]|uniref:Secreted protein n=1 Tax=Anisakis simplex TaxID=6269 RepID=A0A0M3KEH2_ANISI
MKFLITSIATLLIGAVSITIGILLLTFFPLRIDNEVAKRIYLGYNENGTYNDMTLKWIDPEYSMMLQIWIFSLENEEDVIKNGAFPNFTQKGPYSFTEVQHKEHINFLMNATRVTYRNKRFYTFDANSSCASCSLGDQVTFPNVVFQ